MEIDHLFHVPQDLLLLTGPGVASISHCPKGTQVDKMEAAEYLLKENLSLYPNAAPLYRVGVAATHIDCESVAPDSNTKSGVQQGTRKPKKTRIGAKSQVLHFDDIIGCDCMKGKQASDKRAYLTVYLYPLKKKGVTGKKVLRHRVTITFGFGHLSTYEDNLKEAERWRTVITCLAKRVQVRDTNDVSRLQVPESKKLLILINPFGGQGKAQSIFTQKIKPILCEAHIRHESKVTEFAGHAKEMMKTLDLDEWGGVAIVSGDGLIHEVLNGLMERPDWEEAIKLPIGALPGGSGNALCSALLHQAGEQYLEEVPLHSSYLIAKHQVRPMDLIAVDTCNGRRLYSFLSMAWGIIADVDIESEKYRSIGEARFTVGALARIINMRKIRGHLSFLPIEKYDPAASSDATLTRAKSMVEPLSAASNSNGAIKRSVSVVEGSQLVSGLMGPCRTEVQVDKARIPSTSEEECADESTRGLEKVLIGGDEEEESCAAASNGQSQAGSQPVANSQSGVPLHPVPTPLLAPLDQPVPADWVTQEDQFVGVVAMYLSHLSRDMMSAPHSLLDDGAIYLGIVRGHVSRMQLLKVLLTMEDGSHIKNPSFEVIKVKAFRIEPEAEQGIMTVDGERVEFGPIQGQVLSSSARVMALPKDQQRL